MSDGTWPDMRIKPGTDIPKRLRRPLVKALGRKKVRLLERNGGTIEFARQHDDGKGIDADVRVSIAVPDDE